MICPVEIACDMSAFRAAKAGNLTGPGLSAEAATEQVVILDPNAYKMWLDPGMTNVAAASELLKPCDARLMRCYPWSTRSNHVGSPPVEIAQIQNRLFD